MKVTPLKCPIFKAGFNLNESLIKILKKKKSLPKEFILVISSKIVSLSENNLINPSTISKDQLIKKEADLYLGKTTHNVHLTIKHGLLIPSAGIDLSNSEKSQYILLPKNPFKSAQEIWKSLKKEFPKNKIGVIISDSRSQPLRRGVTGVSLAHFGFKATKKLIGKKDLFGRKLEATFVNVTDALSSAAVLCMGESDEAQPLAIIDKAPVSFSKNSKSNEILIEIKEDLFFNKLFKKREI
jgi:coenzyme F420-0:L-glutamate ligase